MWRKFSAFIFAVSSLCLMSFNVFAQSSQTTTSTEGNTTTEVTTTTTPSGGTVVRKTITTEAPAPKVIVTTPSNYVNCFRVEAGWHNEIWVPAHQICQYQNSPQGAAWVEGYWACQSYKMDTGECTNWEWVDAHWQKVLDVY